MTKWVGSKFSELQIRSFAQSCPTLSDPMNRTRQASLSITNFQFQSLGNCKGSGVASGLTAQKIKLTIAGFFIGLRQLMVVYNKFLLYYGHDHLALFL